MKTKAVVLYEMGIQRPYRNNKPLVVQEVNLSEPGPGEVLLDVAAAGLCHSDLSVINGSRPRPMPMVLGHEASGIVKAVGPMVIDFKPGDHVVCAFVPSCGHCIYCATGSPALCENGAIANKEGTLLGGRKLFTDQSGQQLHHHLGISAFSNYTVVRQESLIKIDPAVPLDKAALFGCGVMTGAGAVINTVNMKPGMSVAVFGLGGVGLSSILAAAMSGSYPIIAVDIFEDKLESAMATGASHVVNASLKDPVEEILKTAKQGVDFSFDCVGDEKVFANAYKATVRGGTVVAVGLPHYSVEFNIPGVGIVAEEKIIKGSYMGSAVPKRDIPRLMKLYMAGKLPVEKLYSKKIRLEEINEAFDDLADGTVIRQVLQFD